VVLTGEGADELFAGYDLFREAKVRRFWARQPESRRRPLLLERLYPYLQRSPVSQRAMTRHFFGQGLDSWQSPGFGHGPRWRGTAALQRLFSRDLLDAVAGRDVVAQLVGLLPREFAGWSPLAQDQYLEVRTLLSGYLLSSQGDRMLMAHSVEGRFPYLDLELARLADSLPPRYKLRVLDEKHVLKRVARRALPPEILARKKQPYRAPDAVSFTAPEAPAWVAEVLSEASIRDAGVFDPRGVDLLARKCRASAGGPLAHADNMALVGVLSTQLLHERMVRRPPAPPRPLELKTLVEA